MPRRPSIRRPVLGGITAAALLLTSCGDDDAADTAIDDTAATEVADSSAPADEGEAEDGDAAAAATGACGLLSEDDVASALGEPTDVEHHEPTGGSLEMCEWRFPADEDAIGLPPTLQLVLLGADDYESRLVGAEDLFEEVPGLGDEARWAFVGSEETGYMIQLLALDGDGGIHLNAAGLDLTDEERARDVFVSFAESALSGG